MPKEIREANRIFSALLERLYRIKTLSVVIHENLTDAGSRTVVFPPRRHPARNQDNEPETILACFNLDGSWARYDRVKQGSYHGQPAKILEHFRADGADSYNILYISERTGWPLACGYSLDGLILTEFSNIHVTLRARK